MKAIFREDWGLDFADRPIIEPGQAWHMNHPGDWKLSVVIHRVWDEGLNDLVSSWHCSLEIRQ